MLSSTQKQLYFTIITVRIILKIYKENDSRNFFLDSSIFVRENKEIVPYAKLPLYTFFLFYVSHYLCKQHHNCYFVELL